MIHYYDYVFSTKCALYFYSFYIYIKEREDMTSSIKKLVLISIVLFCFVGATFGQAAVSPILIDTFEGNEIANLLGGKANVYVKAPSRVMTLYATGRTGTKKHY